MTDSPTAIPAAAARPFSIEAPLAGEGARRQGQAREHGPEDEHRAVVDVGVREVLRRESVVEAGLGAGVSVILPPPGILCMANH
jgi:hypothetical protein